jgi:hypothetical protein
MNPEIRRGQEAERVLAEPLLVEAFAAIEAALLQQMKQIDVGEIEAQRDLIVSLQLLGKVRQYIANVVMTGKLAAEQERLSLLQRAKRKFR